MKVFVDIGHPAHVHYFKNFIWKMQGKGHEITIMARDKDVTCELLDYYKFPYFNRGKGRKKILGKLVYILQADAFMFKKAIKIIPDVFLSFGSPYAAQVAWLMRKPHITFDDTDHNILEHIMYVPFTKAILTPKVYLKNQGARQIRFDGFMELCALHPNLFSSNPNGIKNILNLNGVSKYVVLRFVSWDASHDMGLVGLSMKDKYLLVKELSKYVKVIISSELQLPEDLKEYAYSIHPAFMHDLLNEACLLVSESLTMSAEAAFLGTPNLCISTAQAGTLYEEVRLGLIELYRKSDGLVERAIEIIKDEGYKERFKDRSKEIIKNNINVTEFMVWFVENYPGSFDTMKRNPDYQNRFK